MLRIAGLLVFAGFIIATSLIKCSPLPGSADRQDPSSEDSVTAMRVGQTVQAQERWFAAYDSIVRQSDSAAALTALIAMIRSDTTVASVERFSSGITITFTDGYGGALLLKPHRMTGDSAITVRQPQGLQKKYRDGYVVPDGKKTLFLSAMYEEFAAEDNIVRTTGNEEFKQVDFQPFEFVTGSGVSISRLKSLGGSDYGFIRISSHGVPWPSDSPETAIEKVYLVSGETADPSKSVLYGSDLRGTGIRTITSAGPDHKTYYMIDANIFASYNNFGDSKPFVQLAFCYSGLGGWPQAVIGTSKAGGITAFDWSIAFGPELAWSIDLLVNMCDTTRDFPCCLKQWYSEITPTFYDPDFDRVVSIHYYGEDSLAFWPAFKLHAVIPSMGQKGDTLMLAGKNFGDSTGAVSFNSRKIDDILDWNDSIITIIAPDGYSQGTTVEVRVMAHDDTTNFKYFTYSKFTYDYGEFKVKVYGTKECSGDCRDNPPCPDGFFEFWGWGPGVMQGNTFVCSQTESAGDGVESFRVSINPLDSTIVSATYSYSYSGEISASAECALANVPLRNMFSLVAQCGYDRMDADGYLVHASSTSTAGGCTRTLKSYTFDQTSCGIKIYLQDNPD